MGSMAAGVRAVFGLLLALVLIALGIYGLQNQEHIPVYFLFFTFRGTQAWIPAGIFALLVFAICLIYGLFSGALSLFRRHKLVRASSEHRSRIEELTRNLEEARSELARARETPPAPAADPPPVTRALHDPPGPPTPE